MADCIFYQIGKRLDEKLAIAVDKKRCGNPRLKVLPCLLHVRAIGIGHRLEHI